MIVIARDNIFRPRRSFASAISWSIRRSPQLNGPGGPATARAGIVVKHGTRHLWSTCRRPECTPRYDEFVATHGLETLGVPGLTGRETLTR